MPDRKKQPKITTLQSFNYESIPVKYLSNSIPYYVMNACSQDVIKIDFLFNAGESYSENPMVPEIVNALINSGTKFSTSAQIAEKLDFYGAFLELSIGKHTSQITLYTLNKFFKETLSVVDELIFGAVFPKDEIDIYLQNELQKYYISRQKTNVISQELFYETIFGSKHPYGRKISEIDFNKPDYNKITEFYTKYYTPDNLTIVISGRVSDKHISYFEKLIGSKPLQNFDIIKPQYNSVNKKPEQLKKQIDEAVQTSVIIGNKTINRLHPDFYNLNITTIILGGYFGSRLMKNIREEKAYAYGIHSRIRSFINDGVLLISTQSGKDVYLKAIDEIYKELNILRTTYVSKEELNRVQNYLTGSIALLFDGVFEISDSLLSLIPYGLNLDYYREFFNTIKKISPEIIKETAEKYLKEDIMTEVAVGAI